MASPLQSGGPAEPGQPNSPDRDRNGSVDQPRPGTGPAHHSPCSGPASSSPRRPLRTDGGTASPAAVPDPAGRSGSIRPRGLSLGSRIRVSRIKTTSSQQKAPEALLDLVLECQAHRLEDQRASLSLLPDPGPESLLCGACSPDQLLVPSLDFYYKLIQYQSHRMEDQRCPLPEVQDHTCLDQRCPLPEVQDHSGLDQRGPLPEVQDCPGLLPEAQEDFFSLVQRVQSRRMNEQRVSMESRDTEEDQDTLT